MAEGTRFASDLREIREARGISVEEIHEETKIPLGLIRSFEESALFDHSQFNRVYLRSFVRTYAQVIGISADVAMEALEAAFVGEYTGQLAVEYLGAEAEGAESAAAQVEGDTDGDAADDREPGRDEAQIDDQEADQEAEQEPPPASRPDRPERQPQGRRAEQAPPKRTESKRTEPKGAETKRTEPKQAKPEDSEAERTKKGAAAAAGAAGEADWTAQSPPSGRPRAQERKATPSSRKAARRKESPPWLPIAGAVVGVAAVAALVFFLWPGGGGDAERAGAALDTAASAIDTTAVSEPEPPPRPAIVLGDTMTFHVVAQEGKLDPIRVTVDEDLRRPYWIEQGDSMRFLVRDRIVVEELLDVARVSVEGERYPMNRRDAQGRLVITRDSVRSALGATGGP